MYDKPNFKKLYVVPNTMVAKKVIRDLELCLDKILKSKIKGSIVECGVYKGGLSALILQKINLYKSDKMLYLYDTFNGMSEPNEKDIGIVNKESAFSIYKEKQRGEFSDWCLGTLDEVTNLLEKTDPYYSKKTRIIQGKVENTLIYEKNLPERIALCRLDTDWYESTKIELEVLFPRIEKNGILIIDDYGHWEGCKIAVDEFFADKAKSVNITNGSSGTLIVYKTE